MGKVISIDGREKEIQALMKRNGYTREEAEDIWVWDNTDIETEETEKAAAAWRKMSRTAHDSRTIKTKEEQKPRKKRTVQPNEAKRFIIDVVHKLLNKTKGVENLVVENIEKTITFSYQNNDYKLDLIQKRKEKAEGS